MQARISRKVKTSFVNSSAGNRPFKLSRYKRPISRRTPTMLSNAIALRGVSGGTTSAFIFWFNDIQLGRWGLNPAYTAHSFLNSDWLAGLLRGNYLAP
jgi:hypothetical protein